MADSARSEDTADASDPIAAASSSAFSEAAIVKKVTRYVKEYMSEYNSSHDFDHVMRVLGLSRIIASSRLAKAKTAVSTWNPLVLTLGALLHHVGDGKHPKANEKPEANVKHDVTIYQLLLTFGTPMPVAEQVQIVVNNVSYSTETKSEETREYVRKLVQEIPELGIIQDAHRLDAIGSIGIGRTFTYGGAISKTGRPLHKTMAYFVEKLERLEASMKTPEGKRLALERTNRLKLFRGWWEEEMALAKSGLGQ
ncbi:TPA_exp: Uncharacterized protein A8136_5775 [Trichophyton benhamiae CBS 112371]|uniref:HD domain-containing protein n=1 Tax=Arthroderma benhamiae (strain ATCC MYA-4681 / CBS 112371) TaxID=663331 RepID=D4APH0_ARTBC|nr:uncharacterized protein ARB_06138 [Trichophyton benhamiae CBS 112371]EFE35181.1 hypothetical protein ARB_06138 [Trichophyton benhamiae CBS 112371]DAA78072.1 TPA_exp: Uncharacterized protein A8136_5775 [Trichophyton benhamiae CBS 112371]